MKNISLFVAPNEKTHLKYLVEYIYRSINLQLSKTGSEEHEMKEILKSLKFGIKFNHPGTWISVQDMEM